MAKTSPGAMVPAMFSTSVLERRKSLDPGAMLRDLEASEAIFVDKENRPPKADGAKDVKVKVGDGYMADWVGGLCIFFCVIIYIAA